MRKRNIKKLIEQMTGKKKKKKTQQTSAVKDALIGRKYFSKGSDSMIRQAQTNYNGSYISGDLGGVSVSNPSLRKYYKGLV